MQIPFLKWNRLSQQICWALSVMKLICQCLGPPDFIKVKQGHISEMHFWTEENAYVSCCQRCFFFFSVAWENNREKLMWGHGRFVWRGAFANCTFLFCCCSHVILIWKGTCLLSQDTFTFQRFRWWNGRYPKKLFLFPGFWESIQYLMFSLDFIMPSAG